MKVTPQLALAFAFVFQVMVGSLAFFLLYLVAIGLSAAVHYVNSIIVGSAFWLPRAADGVEIAIFAVDVVAFGMFALSELLRFARALLKEWSASDV